MVLMQDATSSSSPRAPLAGATGPLRARRPRRYGMIGRRRATKAARGIGAKSKGGVPQGKQQQQQQAVGSRQSTCIDSMYAADASRRVGVRLGADAATADQSTGGDALAVLGGSEAAPLPNPFVSAVDSPWSTTLSHAEADQVRGSLGLAPAAQQQLSVPTAAAQVVSALQQLMNVSPTTAPILKISDGQRRYRLVAVNLDAVAHRPIAAHVQ